MLYIDTVTAEFQTVSFYLSGSTEAFGGSL